MGDKWKGSTGLLDDFDYEVEESAYESRDYGTVLKWKGTAVVDGKATPHEMWFSAGKQFKPVDKGARAVHESGDETIGFNTNTAVQELIEKAVEVGAPLKDRDDDPAVAAIWVGLRFHFVGEQRTNTINGEVRKSVRMLPTEFLGEVESGSKKKSSSASAKKSAPAAAEDNGAGDIDPDVLKQARKKAHEEEDYFEFFDYVVGTLGLPRKSPLVQEEGESSIWAKANG